VGLIFALYPIFKDGFPNLKFSPSTFLVALVLMMCAYTFLPAIWFFVARSFGISISFPEAVFSWFFSSIGRYIPGKVWQFVGRVSVLNHPSKSVFSATLYEHVVLMAGAGIFSLIFPKFLYLQLGINFALILVLFFWKFSLNSIISLILAVLYWVFAGLSVFFASRALNLNFGYAEISFVYSFSFVVSYVLPITPAGLGVREGIISLLMGYNPQASSFAVLTRFIILLVDLLMLAFGFLYRRFAK